MEEYVEIIESHPGLVLTSDDPPTWKGFLIVDPDLGVNVDIKLVVPNYPRLRDVDLLFGDSISLLFGTGFEEKIVRLLENTATVSSLLRQLKRIVTNLIKEKYGACKRDIGDLQEGIVGELDAALKMDSPVKISANSGLNAVRLSMENVNVTMRKDMTVNAWKVISSDLPELDLLEPFELNIGSLSEAMTKLHTQVEMLLDTWNQLAEIDQMLTLSPKTRQFYFLGKFPSSDMESASLKKIHYTVLYEPWYCISSCDLIPYRKKQIRFGGPRQWYLLDEFPSGDTESASLKKVNSIFQSRPRTCWVIDPPDPKPYHLYRRIKLTPSLSALITIDPIHVDELPDIKLLGSNSEVAKYRNIMNSQLLNLQSWDPESSIANNLSILMAIDRLPQPPETHSQEAEDKNAIVEDDECCICFAMELDDHSPAQLPVEICNNEKCRRHFHTTCLLKWLQAVAVNQISFNRIHGTCPNCGESISCSVITS